MFKTKRIIALLMTIIMVLGMLPVMTFADAGNSQFGNFSKRNTFRNDTFADVHWNDWFYENVKSAYELGLMQGKGERCFDPESGITLAETLAIAARIHSIYNTGKDDFSESSPWYKVYVEYAKANNIWNENRSDFNTPVTRAEFAVILAKALPEEALRSINRIADNAIPDVTLSDLFGDAVYKLYRAGILTGNDSKGTFAPYSNIKRGEVAAVVTRMADESLRKSIRLDGDDASLWAQWQQLQSSKNESSTGPSSENQQNTPLLPNIPGGGLQGSTYTVTFDANGSDVENLPSAQTIRAGNRAIEPNEPKRAGFTFLGWYTISDDLTKFNFAAEIQSDLVLYAIWAKTSSDGDTVYEFDPNHVKFDDTENIFYIDNIILAFIKDGLNDAAKNTIAESVGGIIAGELKGAANILQIKVKDSNLDTLITLTENLMKNPSVQFAYYDMPVYYDSQSTIYGYRDTDMWDGQSHEWNVDQNPDGSNWGWEAINAYTAWNTYSDFFGSVTVGVIDNGFNTSHEDLEGKITFLNSLGINDEEESHGTPVSGIIGAKNNEVGLCGVAYNSNIISSDWGDFNTEINEFAAFNAMINKGARVINMSTGVHIYDDEHYDDKNTDGSYKNKLYEEGMTYDEYLNRHAETAQRIGILYAAFIANCQKDVLFVESAGNGYNNSYRVPSDAWYTCCFAACSSEVCGVVEERFGLPEGYIKSHILIVTSIENRKKSDNEYYLVSGASRGETVDICAPGRDIYTTGKDGGYENDFYGTSAAAPFVTGVAALCFSINPSLEAAQVREILITETDNSGVAPDNLFGNTKYPLVDANRSVAKAYQMKPKSEDIELEYNGVRYKISADTNEATLISAIDVEQKKFELPDEVPYNGASYKITAIGENAFGEEMWGVEITHFPKYVTYVGDWALYGADLSDTTIPEGLEYIGQCGMWNCTLPESITLNAPITLGEFALRGTPFKLELGEKFRMVDGNFGYSVEGVTEITTSNNPVYTAVANVLYKLNGCMEAELLWYGEKESRTKFTVPLEVEFFGTTSAPVTTIAAYAFAYDFIIDSDDLGTVVLSRNVTTIEDFAFDIYLPSDTSNFNIEVHNYLAEFVNESSVYVSNGDKANVYGFAGSKAENWASSNSCVNFYEMSSSIGIMGRLYYYQGDSIEDVGTVIPTDVEIVVKTQAEETVFETATDGLGIFKMVLPEGSYVLTFTDAYGGTITVETSVMAGQMTDLGELYFNK